MWNRFVSRLSSVNDAYGRFMERIGNPTTNKDFLLGFLIFGCAWALAWYAHIIFPWINSLMGWGPYDIDSARKIQWRRMWSTAICLPAMIALALLYLRKWRELRNFKQ